MKKYFILFIALLMTVLTLSLTGCNDNGNNGTSGKHDPTADVHNNPNIPVGDSELPAIPLE